MKATWEIAVFTSAYRRGQEVLFREVTWTKSGLSAEVPAGVDSRDTGLGRCRTGIPAALVGGSDITFRHHRRVVINLSVRLASLYNDDGRNHPPTLGRQNH